MRLPHSAILLALALLSLCGARAAHSLQAEAPAAVPPLLIEDFEETTLGSRPFLWKEPVPAQEGATIGVERAELDGNASNKALKIEYTFSDDFTAGQAVEAGPGNEGLPGSLTAVTMMVFGDAGKNAVALRLRDRYGETFEWQIPVTWTGWKQARVPLDVRSALRGGNKPNGALDLPLVFDAVRVARTQAGAASGSIMVDAITAQCRFGQVKVLYDPAAGVKPDEWKANRTRSVIGKTAETGVDRGGKSTLALQLQYQYEGGSDSSVEYARVVTAGDGHGTLVAEVFGDGSNNILRFRVLDGADKVWGATLPTVLVNWAGWKTLYLDTRAFADPTGQDPIGTIAKFPVKFSSLLIDDCSPKDMLTGVESGRSGEIYLGRVLYCAEK